MELNSRWGAAAGVALYLVVLLVVLYRRARRRPSLDRYAGIPAVKIIPTRPDRRTLEER